MTNNDKKNKTLTLFYYLEWVLGVFREQSAHFTATRQNIETNIILAENSYNNEFSDLVAFCGMFSEQVSINSFTCDRMDFIGRNGSIEQPAALNLTTPLEGKTGCGLDPCAAFEIPLEIKPGETVDMYFMVGQADNEAGCVDLVTKYQKAEVIERAYREVVAFWDQKLSVIKVESPSSEMNVLLNGWLLYQDLSCRIWARSAFYQSGGAYGYRDQLQDVAALVYSDPEITRNQILLHAAHQFIEGDVLHWWHPPTGRGIRSRFSDDLLWLPYTTAYYVQKTGNYRIFDEEIPFLKARLLEEDEDEAYLLPETTTEKASLYEHCCRAIEKSLTRGIHDLPLMGSGDWNDGMNLVGNKGQGESVWLGFFLYKILSDFIPFCRKRSDNDRLKKFKKYSGTLKEALNKNAWDGNWFLRALL